MNRLKQHWRNVRSSFWFMPSLIVVVSTVAAVALIETDSTGIDRWLARWPRLFGAGAEGARGMMSTIAGSMMTVVGVTFSMILVVLALASSQYTSRLLRSFTRSRVTQVVLGILAGVFTCCLIVLRNTRGGDEDRETIIEIARKSLARFQAKRAQTNPVSSFCCGNKRRVGRLQQALSETREFYEKTCCNRPTLPVTPPSATGTK